MSILLTFSLSQLNVHSFPVAHLLNKIHLEINFLCSPHMIYKTLIKWLTYSVQIHFQTAFRYTIQSCMIDDSEYFLSSKCNLQEHRL